MIYIDLDAFFKKTIAHMGRLLFPPKCIFCKALTDASSPHEAVCVACTQTLTLVGWVNGATRLGPALVPVDGVFAGCAYTELVKSAIVRLKFYDVTGAARPLAYMMARGLRNYADLFDYVVPVPLSAKRFSHRGYNQSELIAKELCHLLGKTLDAQGLHRVKHTKKQSLTKGLERQENVAQAFQAGSEYTGKTVLLIDDVLTTGSTAAECACVLREAGAFKIYIAVVALAI